jgi:hypothetical protein
MVSLSFHLQNWNAYVGRLGRKDFCFNVSKSEKLQNVLDLSSILNDNGKKRPTVGVIINFTVDEAVLREAAESTVFHGTFTGSKFTTQIGGTDMYMYMHTVYLKWSYICLVVTYMYMYMYKP